MVSQNEQLAEISRLYHEAGKLEAEKVLRQNAAALYDGQITNHWDRFTEAQLARDAELQVAHDLGKAAEKAKKRAAKLRRKVRGSGRVWSL